jgi:hypothetical protein
MKQTFHSPFSFLLFSFLLFTACNDLLDPEVNLSLTADQVMTSYSNTMNRALAVYTFLPDGFSSIDGAMMASATDEAEHTQLQSSIHKFNTGAWNPVDNPDGAWASNFSGIYNANLFLANSDSVNIDYLKYDPAPATQLLYQSYLENIHRWKYEVRFLRAFFYFELVKRYGGVPLIVDPVKVEDTDQPRQSLSACIQFIVDECDSAALVLPARYKDEDLGRATKGAALALKSRVLLYAASDLFNDPSWANGYEHPELISLPDDKSRQERWEEAAQAALAVITLDDSGYSIVPVAIMPYSDIFRTYNNAEIIFAKRSGSSNTFEKANYPIGYDLGKSGTTPSQNLVDAYEVKINNAQVLPFDWDNPAHAANPYSNRDPRLYETILTNGSSFKGRQVETYTGGRDGKGIADATRTGYYLKKYLDPNLDLLQDRKSVHTWILFRFSEIYLNFAEAANEAYGPMVRPAGSDWFAYRAYSQIRLRVTMSPLFTTDKSRMKEEIRHERRIELAFEDHRFWDVRRWMIAGETLNVPLRGIEITKNADNFDYKVTDVENRSFQPKMYFYPIPQKDLNIAKSWIQNPIWK